MRLIRLTCIWTRKKGVLAADAIRRGAPPCPTPALARWTPVGRSRRKRRGRPSIAQPESEKVCLNVKDWKDRLSILAYLLALFDAAHLFDVQ
jgi:hypothetical protein